MHLFVVAHSMDTVLSVYHHQVRASGKDEKRHASCEKFHSGDTRIWSLRRNHLFVVFVLNLFLAKTALLLIRES